MLRIKSGCKTGYRSSENRLPSPIQPSHINIRQVSKPIKELMEV